MRIRWPRRRSCWSSIMVFDPFVSAGGAAHDVGDAGGSVCASAASAGIVSRGWGRRCCTGGRMRSSGVRRVPSAMRGWLASWSAVRRSCFPFDLPSALFHFGVAQPWPFDLTVIRNLPRPVPIPAIPNRCAAFRVSRVVGSGEFVPLPHASPASIRSARRCSHCAVLRIPYLAPW